MRALIFGGTGMLGSAVAAEWRHRKQPACALSRDQADIRDRRQLLERVESFRPRLVVNCAAFTQVDACETERETAFEVNGDAVANVVEAAESAGADLIHISSDYVFDGSAREPYPEDAAPRPLSVYGESKLAGENQALRYPRALVVRSSWLFGPGGANFVVTIRRLLGEDRGPLRVVDDQVGCPTYTPFLARALWHLARQGLRGIVHYCNRDAVSWHGFATRIAQTLAPERQVLRVPTSEFPRPAARPAYSVLDTKRFETTLGRPVESWAAGLTAYLSS